LRRRRRIEFLFQGAGRGIDGLPIGRSRRQSEVIPVSLKRILPIVQRCLVNNGEIKNGRGVIGLGLGCRSEGLGGFRGVIALHLDDTDSVERLGILGVQLAGLIEAFFCGRQIARAQLGIAEFRPGVRGLIAMQGVSSEFGFGEIGAVLFEPKAAQVIMNLNQILVQGEGPFVSVGGILGLAGLMIGKAEIIPGVRVGVEQLGRRLQLAHGFVIFAFFEEVLSVQERAGAGRFATGEGCSDKDGE